MHGNPPYTSMVTLLAVFLSHAYGGYYESCMTLRKFTIYIGSYSTVVYSVLCGEF